MGMSEYVRGLRARVGNDLLFMPSAHALIRDGDGRILLVRHVEGRWLLPGGAVEPGEGPAEAVVRECLEEIGVPVEIVGLVGVYGGPQYEIVYANGDRAGWVVTILEARIVSGEPAPSDDETTAAAWFAPEEIDGLELSVPTRDLLRRVLAGERF